MHSSTYVFRIGRVLSPDSVDKVQSMSRLTPSSHYNHTTANRKVSYRDRASAFVSPKFLASATDVVDPVI